MRTVWIRKVAYGHKVTTSCPSGYTLCGDGMLCISEVSVCNGHQDCYDASDEANCTSANDSSHGYQILGIGVDQPSINSTSFLISFWMSQQKLVLYSFLPSISKVEDGVWKNMTWIHESAYRFNDLEPYTQYNVTFYIKDSRSNKTYASSKYVNTTTGEGVPSPPLKLSVSQLTGSRINVVWDPPSSPKGVVQRYTLHFTPPVPPLQKDTDGAETNITVNGFFKPGKNYSFWVTATNGAFTSPSSEVKTILFDDVGDVDGLTNISLARKNASTAVLSWPKIRGVEGYRILVRPPRPRYVPWEPIFTPYTNVTLTNLPTGVRSFVDVSPYKGAIIGIPFTIYLEAQGIKDEELNSTAYLVQDRRTSVNVSWSPPSGERYKGKELEYIVYYHDVMHMLFSDKESKIITKNTSVLIDNLHACETYNFAVTLVNGPMARVHEIMTRENAKAPVKNIRFSFNEDKSRMEIIWNANCDVINEPVKYRVDITEETHNKVSRYELAATKNVTLSHVIENVPVGGRYNICIQSAVEGSAVACGRARGRVIPPPENVVAWLAPNGLLMVNWDDHSPGKYTYEIIVSKDEIPEDTVHVPSTATTSTATNSPRLVDAPVTTGVLYCAVRAVSADRYYSDLSEVQTLTVGASEARPQQSAVTALWWGGGAALIGGLLLGGALLHVVLRNRRLARSFLRFSYDSRRGQATIGDHDDDDVPPIHGFSDDEPLVIA